MAKRPEKETLLQRLSRVYGERGLLFPFKTLGKKFVKFYRLHIYEHFELAVCVRDNRDPLPNIPRHFSEGMEVRIAVPEDEKYYATQEWQHLHKRFQALIPDPNFTSLIGIAEGRMVSTGFWYRGPFKDPRLKEVFDNGPTTLYTFGGETSPAAMGKGAALIGYNWLFEHLEENLGCDKVMVYYQLGTMAAKRLHDRYWFVPQFVLDWRKIGPFRFSHRLPVPEDYQLKRPGEGE